MTNVNLDLYSEPYGATGNIGENFRRLLGAPSLDPFQTVIREAVQNIADAAKLGTGPEVLVRLRTLSGEQRTVLSAKILQEIPDEARSQELLVKTRSCQDLKVLEICDFQTIGLGGPTRSDRIPIDTQRTDFIDFLRNIGTPRDAEHGGGTYGFGKVALYRASRCGTILVDTLPHGAGAAGRRLIGCHIGQSFEIPEDQMLRRFTGRHWWGKADPLDGVVDPLEGKAAVEIAAALGFPERSSDRSGTSIMILDYEPEEEDLDAEGQRVIESLLWNFWPRMMRDVPQERRFSCRVEVNDRELAVPAPEDFPPLDLFCKAMLAARSGTGPDVRRIESQRPAKFLGTLALARGLRSPRRPLVAERSLFPSNSRHIALMRPVELVVKYLEGSSLPDERLEWAGVFVASREDEVEHAFAESEPPAHDDWIPDNLPSGRGKRYVNLALRRVREVALEMGTLGSAVSDVPAGGPPLARVAGKLGAFLGGIGGDGAGGRRQTGGGGGRQRTRARATPPVFDRLEFGEHGRVAVFTTEVIQDRGGSGASLAVSASIAIEGKGTGRIADEIEQPSVLSITPAAGGPSTDGATLFLDGKEGEFDIRVIVPDSCAVIVDAEVLDKVVT